jgi:hypothetical protein
MSNPKRIILLSDGTGNSASKIWKSNVWRVFESLDLRGNEQVAFYDDGVGTSSFKPLAILGGAFGWGLKRNVLDIYKFLCANYQPGDEIFGFGFSRGAFTMRVVTGLVLNQGLVRGATDAEIYQNAKMAYRAYRAEKFHTVLRIEYVFRLLRNWVLLIFGVGYDKKNNQQIDAIEFLGLWDTVAAYGLPIDEMARGVSQWLWPLELPNRAFDPRIRRACHALSLDDERTTFHPVLWNEKDVPPGQLTQVWFAGVHSNVGGGYPDDSLAYIPLYWIMREAQNRGLDFKTMPNQPNNPDPDMMVHTEWSRDKDGRLYDSRNGLGGYYRYGPRKIEDLSHMRFSLRKDDFVDNGPPTIHETAITRARIGAHRYAPIGIPAAYQVMTDQGVQPQAGFESQGDAKVRCEAQEAIWNQVWRRRFIYFITVFASIYMAVYPLAVTIDSSGEYATRLSLVSSAIRAVGGVLPGAFSVWVDAYASDPSHFIVLGFFVVLLIGLGVSLGKTIEDKMERVWRNGTPANMSKVGIAVRAVGFLLAGYAILHRYLPSSFPAQEFLDQHVSTPVEVILVSTMIALFTPASVVYHLRTWWIYRFSIRGIKLYGLPFAFALSFVALAILFGSHLAFSVEDAFGAVCEQSPGIARETTKEKREDHGLDACLTAVVATCGAQDKVPTCSNHRVASCGEGTAVCETRRNPVCDPAHADCDYRVPVCHVSMPAVSPGAAPVTRASGFVVCPASCEVRPNADDRVTKNIDNLLDISSVCKATGIWLEQGQKYRVTIAPGPGQDDAAWKKNPDINVSTRGLDVSKLTPVQRFWQFVYWPLKRHLFVEPFKVIARVGSTGSDERVLEPDDNPKSNKLDVTITPKRGGELFLYVNEAVWAYRKGWESFYKDNSGKATIAVRRAAN